MKNLKRIFLLCTASLILVSCFEDLDDNISSTTGINDFVWKALNLWYFWQQDVPDLADDRFDTDQEYTSYLNSFDTPEDLFNSLKFNEDRFSIITSNYFDLINSLDGVTRTNGMEFGLARINNGSELFGFVQYILPNSDAETQNVIRGQLFRTVDGTNLTETNFADLLFGDNNTYTIGLADINGNDVVLNGNEITLTKEVLTENPIFINEVFEVDGIKIGYLMYNQFNNEFDNQLNDVFASFAANGIDELVLDLRYNLGGSVSTAIYLSSMITGQYTGDLYLKRRFNDKINDATDEESLKRFFVNQFSDGTSINSLNLNNVYILAQGSSASASELVINCLRPYLGSNLVHIGDTTRGKNEFSTLLLDVPGCGFISSSECDDVVNPSHTYGMLPLIGRNENADGFLDYTNGLNADIIFAEDLANLGVLGNVDEPLLERAIEEITGTRTSHSINTNTYETITNSKLNRPIKDIMIFDDDLPILKN